MVSYQTCEVLKFQFIENCFVYVFQINETFVIFYHRQLLSNKQKVQSDCFGSRLQIRLKNVYGAMLFR